MASSLNRVPTAITIDVEDLISRAWGGDIRVPHFQRDFRWGWEDVRRLFDSIVRGYPVGSLLLWQRYAPAAKLRLGALDIDAPETERAYWVVDGQQRVTSLANALSPRGGSDPRFALSYDLVRDELVRPSAAFKPHIVPLPVLFDLQSVIRWFAENPGVGENLEKATRITKTLRQYKVPAYLVESEDPEILQDIFDRMNTFGKRLRRAEIFTALNAGSETDMSAATLHGIAVALDEATGFGIIDDDTVLAAVLARRNPQVKRDIRHEFDAEGDEGLQAAYQATEIALRNAIEFLQNTAGVPHYSLLAYKYLVVVLTRFFAHHPEVERRNLQLLRRWYWQAAVVGPERFKGGTPNAARILCGKIAEDDVTSSVQRLIDAVHVADLVRPEAKKFNTKDASTKILLCSLWRVGPRDPRTGEAYTQSDIADSLSGSPTAQPAVQSIVPRNEVPIEYRGWAATRALMPGLDLDEHEVVQFFSGPTLDLEPAMWQDILNSHLVTQHASQLLGMGRVGDFLRARQEAVEASLQEFLEEACEFRFESTPPLASLDLDAEFGGSSEIELFGEDADE